MGRDEDERGSKEGVKDLQGTEKVPTRGYFCRIRAIDDFSSQRDDYLGVSFNN
jgi:hypothetical protein